MQAYVWSLSLGPLGADFLATLPVSPWVYNQHWVMLRKKDVSLTAEEMLEPGGGPREWLALRHNITQLQREIDASAGAGTSWDAPTIKRIQQDYESSLSWRVTAPLRALKIRLRR